MGAKPTVEAWKSDRSGDAIEGRRHDAWLRLEGQELVSATRPTRILTEQSSRSPPTQNIGYSESYPRSAVRGSVLGLISGEIRIPGWRAFSVSASKKKGNGGVEICRSRGRLAEDFHRSPTSEHRNVAGAAQLMNVPRGGVR